ncbi:propionyl-CoA synthetase [Salinimonas sp. HHU 13199]|uniref:Propionyl-CoA synthetase n=1 Tax=Salinimonas profundi TaxID=2729140 RepID=A0ABR8LHK2_9ALTE|nr:propionyl-CoA synthetase [Salinimonas profundi]MBD3585008.1 propionyl-CoA synthetase [Salinimonas profundi]
MDYQSQYKRAISDPRGFWQEQARKLPWYTFPETILSDTAGRDEWFADGQMNTCYMALDHHVKHGRGDQLALIYDSPVTGTKQSFTYQDLLNEVSQFAGALKQKGVEKGDRVVIYMPMIPQAAIAMLACARLGAIHSVVFGGFAPRELAVRIDDAKPDVIVTASCGIEVDRVIAYKPLVDEAIRLASHSVNHCIVYQREQVSATLDATRDSDWCDVTQHAQPAACTSVNATDPLYILYTSGTTGKPKGVVRDNGGHAVALNFSLSAIYNIKPGDVFWAASDVGWVVGHSYIIYGPLIYGATTIMYEGKPVKTPDAGAFWRVIEEYKVNVIFAAPTAFRAIRKEDPDGKKINAQALSSLRAVYMAGERLDPATYDWTREHTGKPVIDHWWQTETGWPICANPVGIEAFNTKPGSSTLPVPGFNVQVLDESGNTLPAGEQGAIAIRLPLPPGCLPTIWQDDERFKASYLSRYDGYYCSGDGGYKDNDGYVFIMGRTDDVINVAGHRLSTGEMEEVLAAHPAVAECTVIGVADSMKGQVPLGMVLLKDGAAIDEATLEAELIAMVRDAIGPVASFKQAIVVPRLPKTRSGKILRKVLRQMVSNEPLNVPSTIDDPQAIDDVKQCMRKKGVIS